MPTMEIEFIVYGERISARLVPNTIGKYAVTKTGRAFTLTGGRCKELKPFRRPDGYYQLNIDGKSERLHRLVCRVFHGDPPNNEMDAAHNDGDKSNNNATNLRWATRADNIRDQFTHGTHFSQTHYSPTRKDKLSLRVTINKHKAAQRRLNRQKTTGA